MPDWPCSLLAAGKSFRKYWSPIFCKSRQSLNARFVEVVRLRVDRMCSGTNYVRLDGMDLVELGDVRPALLADSNMRFSASGSSALARSWPSAHIGLVENSFQYLVNSWTISGAGGRTRTCDLCLVLAALCPLSYTRNSRHGCQGYSGPVPLSRRDLVQCPSRALPSSNPSPPHRARRRSVAGRRGSAAGAGEEGEGGVEVGDDHELPAARGRPRARRASRTPANPCMETPA